MKEKKYSVTQEQLNDIAAIAAEKAVQVYRSEEGRARRKAENANARITRKKLESYRRVKTSLSEPYEFTDNEKIELRWKFVRDLMGSDFNGVEKAEDRIRTIENKRRRDSFEIQMIDRALALYGKEAKSTSNEEFARRYRELRALFIDDPPMTAKEVADAEGISEKTVYHDIGIACNVMSAYLLGM